MRLPCMLHHARRSRFLRKRSSGYYTAQSLSGDHRGGGAENRRTRILRGWKLVARKPIGQGRRVSSPEPENAEKVALRGHLPITILSRSLNAARKNPSSQGKKQYDAQHGNASGEVRHIFETCRLLTSKKHPRLISSLPWAAGSRSAREMVLPSRTGARASQSPVKMLPPSLPAFALHGWSPFCLSNRGWQFWCSPRRNNRRGGEVRVTVERQLP